LEANWEYKSLQNARMGSDKKNYLAANCANEHEFNVSMIRVFSRAFAAKILICVHLRKSAASDFSIRVLLLSFVILTVDKRARVVISARVGRKDLVFL